MLTSGWMDECTCLDTIIVIIKLYVIYMKRRKLSERERERERESFWYICSALYINNTIKPASLISFIFKMSYKIYENCY
jgi:hypothetical protein